MANGMLGSLGFEGFFGLLQSLRNFTVSVLTEGDVGFVTGILTDVNSNFITICSGVDVNYIPINQITIISRIGGIVAGANNVGVIG
ncbi:MAG: hypothetical protein ACM3QZ_01120 [Solirubrobacterales bacterium]